MSKRRQIEEQYKNELADHFKYSPDSPTGLIKISGIRTDLIGLPAGSESNDGYFCTYFKGVLLANHRIIFIIHNGYVPDCVDHKDGDKNNQHPDNLRDCSQVQNMYNRKTTKARKQTHLPKGVNEVMKDGRKYYVGQISTADGRKSKMNKDLQVVVDWLDSMRKQHHKEFCNYG